MVLSAKLRPCESARRPWRCPIAMLLGLLWAAEFVLGCHGSTPVREPPDPGTVGGSTRPRALAGPVLLRYRWDTSANLIYRVTTGEADPKDGAITGRRSTYRLSLTPIHGRDAAAVQCRRSSAEGIMHGEVSLITEEQESAATAEVDARGRVMRLLEVKGDEIPTGTLLATGGRTTFAVMVVGFLPAELALGVMHACPLPERPVKPGDLWRTTVGIPSTTVARAGPAVRYEGKLVRLEETSGSIYAVIESSVFPPDMDAPYVVQTQFDVRRGRVVFAKWRALPGARERHPARWVELMQ